MVAWGMGESGDLITVLLGDVAEVLEESAAVLASDDPELAPCCCGRAGNVAEALPVADACE